MVTVSVVVPTFNEEGNIPSLLPQIIGALKGISFELLIVDDSTDGTPLVVQTQMLQYAQIRLVHREGDERDGLSGAVLRGFAEATGEYIVVLDADLQHPPAVVRTLLDAAYEYTADVVIASRYIPGGGIEGLDGFYRKACSIILKELTRLLLRPRLGNVKDPLSGFFLFRRSLLKGVTLQPIGWKILLEVLARTPHERVSEVPYCFQARGAGESKASLKQGVTFLRHLLKLTWETPWLLQPNKPLLVDESLSTSQ